MLPLRLEDALRLLKLQTLSVAPFGPSRLHEEVEVGDAPLDERHPRMVQEVLDLLPAGPAGDDVAHEEIMPAAGLGVSELNWASCLPEAGIGPKNRIGVPFKVASEHSLVHQEVRRTMIPVSHWLIQSE